MSLVYYCMPSQNSIILEKHMDFGGQRTKCLMLSLPLSHTHIEQIKILAFVNILIG